MLRCEWKALLLAPGLDVAGIRAIDQLGRYFATPIASRFFKVRAETLDDGSTRAHSTPVEGLSAANRLELLFASPDEGGTGTKATGGVLDLPTGDEPEDDGDRLLVETAMGPTASSPSAVWLILEVDADRWGGIPPLLDRILDWSREELEAGRVLGARFATKGGATMPGPEPPLAGDALMLCVEVNGVEREYGTLERYVGAFDQHERFGSVVRVTRAIEADVRMRRRRLLDSNGALARIARPRRTLWIPPIPPPLGVALERPDRPALKLSATRDPGPIAEYTCSLTKTQHIDPAEIAVLQALISNAEPLDGRHVAGVSVFFDDEETARREMRPLRDVGARVFVREGEHSREIVD
jgi:hypothetical protein